MTEHERLAILETQMKSIAETMKEMVQDVKELQKRWAMILGGVALLSNLTDIIHFFERH